MDEYKKIGKNARNVMLMSSVIVSIICTVILFLIWYFLRNPLGRIGGMILLIIGAVIWIVSLIEPFVRCERYRYRFTEEEIDIKEGFLLVERNVVPIERLHKISMISGPLDRIFGLSKVIVTTAGGDVVIRFLDVAIAEGIVENLKKRINTYAIAQRELERIK